jgi:hypothetical protein
LRSRSSRDSSPDPRLSLSSLVARLGPQIHRTRRHHRTNQYNRSSPINPLIRTTQSPEISFRLSL